MQTQRNSHGGPREQNKGQNPGAFNLSASEKLLIMEALDHIFVTRQYQEMGSCVVCKKISIKKCTGCTSFYCSSECQTFDWPKHRNNCSKGRDNLSERSSFGSTRGMKECSSLGNFNEDSGMVAARSSPFTALANQLSKKSGNGFRESRSLANFKIGNKQYQSRNQHSRGGGGDVIMNGNGVVKEQKTIYSQMRKKNFSPKVLSSNKKFSPDEKNKSNFKNSNHFVNNKLEKSTEWISNGSSTGSRRIRSNLKKMGKVQVIAMYRESAHRYWVLFVDALGKFEEIQAVLKKECKYYDSVQPEVGLVYGCMYSGEWFRGEVKSVSPELTVHFIDFGNVSTYESAVIKQLPENLATMPGLAFLIEFEKGTPSKYITEVLDSSIITVEQSSKAPDGVSRVNIIEGMYGATEKPTEETKPTEEKNLPNGTNRTNGINGSNGSNGINGIVSRSVMDVLTPTSSGMLFFVPGDGTTRYGSLVPDNHKESNESMEKVLNIECTSAPYEAEEGDYVLVNDNEGNDQRGKVVTKLKSSYYVQLIDCGNVVVSECVYPLPENLRTLIELGVKVTIEEMISDRNLETCFFAITGKPTAGKWPCNLKSKQLQVIAKVLLEKPEEKVEWQPKYACLKSGSTVEISYASPGNSLYVRTVDVEIEQKFMDMNMEMNQFGPKAQCFDIPPLPGELCCAQFYEDNCFYRAVVNSVKDGKVVVLFVDFGNEQETDFRDIKPLPENLKRLPFFASKVELSNVSDKPWNNMIKDYIRKLTSRNVELILTYTDSLSNGVTLREKVSGVVVNEFIEKSSDRSDSRNGSLRSLSQSPEIFLEDDITFTKLSPGSTCTLAVLYVSENEFESTHTFWATSADEKNFNYVNLELSAMICQHCEKDSTPHKPALRELCLAEFEGSWYRAVCGGIEGDIYKVFFIDFGNICELKSESIRKMQKEFIKAPALVMNCALKGGERLKGNSALTKEVFNALLDRINTFIEGVTVVKFQEESWVLEIPEIEAMFQR